MSDSVVRTAKTTNPSDKPRVLPHSKEAEQSVLGGVMLSEDVWDKVSEKLVEEDFYLPNHRVIFKAMASMSRQSKPLDVLTLSETLKENNQLNQAGGDVYLFELANNTPTVSNLSAYADIVHERAVLRHLIQAAHAIADHAFNPKGRNGVELIQEAEQTIFNIAEQRDSGKHLQNLSHFLAGAVERIDMLYHSKGELSGVETGFSDFDHITNGLQAGDLIILAGRPSMGKTAFGMNIAEHVAIKSDKPVLVFSLEMPGEALALRMLSSLGRIDQHKIRSGRLEEEDWPRISSSVGMLSEAKMYIDDSAGLSPAEIRGRVRRLAKEYGELGLIVIDYLQLMQVPGFKENRTNEISEISRSLKGLAKEFNVPVIALSQLNRSLEQRQDKRPIMSDLRESGAIEQDADLILFIYRDEVYHEDSPDKGTAEIIIAKHRNGPIGKVRLSFLGLYTRFENFQPLDVMQ